MSYITNIKIENIRSFPKLSLNFLNLDKNPRMRTVILGKNGTCKTTLLRCIAIGLCEPEEGNSLVSEPIGKLIAENAPKGKITINLQPDGKGEGAYSIITSIAKKNGKEIVLSNQIESPSLPDDLFVCGYGAGRSTEGPDKFREYRIIDSVYSLFSYDEPLIGTELTLRRLQDYLDTKEYEYTIKGIMKALGLTEKDKIELPKGGGVLISGASIGQKVPIEGWADGYRVTFNWIMDLYARAMRANNVTPSGGIKGILLIDELDQHLHPSMQTDMLPNFSILFPDLQIVTTTHSPLVALGALPEEVIALKRKIKYVYSDVTPDFTGYSAEDMLVDDRLFDTVVYSPSTSKKLNQYQKLVSIPKNKRTKPQVEKMQKLARELRAKQLPEVQENPLSDELRKFRAKYDL